MRFLVTNDDGLGAPGLELLARIAGQFGEVVMVAPACEQSGISHRVTFERPLQIKEIRDGVWSVDGTPADCIRIAVAKFGRNFDWVLSGINDGANLGVDIFYSGTVAAAREAFLLGIPAIALSQYRKKYLEPFNWDDQKDVVEKVLSRMLDAQPTKDRWVNVNLPDRIDPSKDLQIIECEVDLNPFPTNYVEVPDGFELRLKYADRPRNSGQDVDVCFNGNVSISHRSQ